MHTLPLEQHFKPVETSLGTTLRGIQRATMTLINTPAHDHDLFKEVGNLLKSEPQPVEPPPLNVANAVLEILVNEADPHIHPRLPYKDLLGMAGVCLQFTCHVPELRAYAETPFEHADDLYQAIVAQGQQKPVSLDRQLGIALQQTSGDLPEAVWRLFITSRLHARWLDSEVITGLPMLTRAEKMKRMYDFSKSITALRPYESQAFQDSAGDAYYCWTHALGGMAFGALSHDTQSFGAKLGNKAMRNGTHLMNDVFFRITSQTMHSDHTIAGDYGNVIGTTFINVLQNNPSTTATQLKTAHRAA